MSWLTGTKQTAKITVTHFHRSRDFLEIKLSRGQPSCMLPKYEEGVGGILWEGGGGFFLVNVRLKKADRYRRFYRANVWLVGCSWVQVSENRKKKEKKKNKLQAVATSTKYSGYIFGCLQWCLRSFWINKTCEQQGRWFPQSKMKVFLWTVPKSRGNCACIIRTVH